MFSIRFPEKRAFITGAASGLGLAFAENLAKTGWRLFIADINETALNKAKTDLEALGANVIAKVVNVAKLDEIEAAAADIKEAWGGVDMVFNNAGISSAGAIDDNSMEEWNRVININLWSVIYGCRTFVPMLKEQGHGYIINTASAAGVLAAPQMSGYNVAKAGVVSLSETLKNELDEFNIGVTVVCPTVFVSNIVSSISRNTGMDKSLIDQMAVCTFSSADVVNAVFNKITKNKLYVMPQTDAKAAWLIKRLLPETYLKLIAFLYKKRLWVFSGL